MSMIQAYLCDSVSGEPYTCKGDLCEIPFSRNFTIDLVNLSVFTEFQVRITMTPHHDLGTFVVEPKKVFSIKRAAKGDAAFKVARAAGWLTDTPQVLSLFVYKRLHPVEWHSGCMYENLETDGGTVIVPGEATGQRFGTATAVPTRFLFKRMFVVKGV
ncbi:immediate early protein ICP-18 [Ranavirus ambystoma1]|uniref:Immediate early protein ICP-18 n=1 Tax=Ranavirus ambystoma1 TaxID=265294 RepID=A0A0U2QJI5_9VIRU|nr:immediate early protein ICP-18 [Ambystoma tigrinum virus]ALN36616.1 immediate early protein ICP-18 [Ambystoma tigrinum virus]ALN37026.1 immediate early protein ICP-18 [Ambystoma tigrinum virus]ALN37326.1 immediate early protein ICP-18 [Ambystoma tigrinum virus]ALN37427.1 immediate early protein ICP-18 [Ambystoma tigrinum virus]